MLIGEYESLANRHIGTTRKPTSLPAPLKIHFPFLLREQKIQKRNEIDNKNQLSDVSPTVLVTLNEEFNRSVLFLEAPQHHHSV
jgi:hypothetical protein